MPTIFTDEDVQRYTRWQRFKMYAKIRAGMTWLHSSWLRLALDLWAQASR